MSVGDELRKQGYKLEYEYGSTEDKTEVWVNDKAGMAVRVEWMRVGYRSPPRPPHAPHPHPGSQRRELPTPQVQEASPATAPGKRSSDPVGELDTRRGTGYP
jgi:hypothetical protein